jgi:DNA-binding MarR family transcriptional regulator
VSTGSERRSALLTAVTLETRRLGEAAAVFTSRVAERAGLAPTDVQCLSFLLETGAAPAGRLAELTGLSLGATTRMIDRLEQAGYVRRAPDPTDRRVVLVALVPERSSVVGERLQALVEALSAVSADYGDDQLRELHGFLRRAVEAVETETGHLLEHAARPTEGGSAFFAPVGGVTEARLVFLSAVPTLGIRGDPALRDLYRASFQGPVPRVRVRAGVVTVRYARFAWFDWRARIGGQMIDTSVHWRDDRGELALHTGVPWRIELRGGGSRIQADLGELELGGFQLVGGASRVELTLPRPVGTVRVPLEGSFNELIVRRPAAVSMRLRISGPSSRVELDGQTITGSAGDLTLESDGAASAADRYDLEVQGSAHHLTVGETDRKRG